MDSNASISGPQKVATSSDFLFFVEATDGLNHFNNKVAVYILVPYVLPYDARIPDEFITYNDGIKTYVDGADVVFEFESLRCVDSNCSLIEGMEP